MKHVRLPVHVPMPPGGWTTLIPLDVFEDGTPLVMTGGDYHLPGPDGTVWEFTAATGSVVLSRVPREEPNDG